mmetsp:Transcript_7886/g.15456  ORF Transcript_7886/g.15456 Transcript_7886/m.15456 type:complete len:146 (+) Transcript_7886:932-1369(+)
MTSLAYILVFVTPNTKAGYLLPQLSMDYLLVDSTLNFALIMFTYKRIWMCPQFASTKTYQRPRQALSPRGPGDKKSPASSSATCTPASAKARKSPASSSYTCTPASAKAKLSSTTGRWNDLKHEMVGLKGGGGGDKSSLNETKVQ